MINLKTYVERVREFLASRPTAAKALHTFWQTFLATVLLGLTPVFSAATSGDVHEAGVALLALVTAALAGGFSAAKTIVLARLRRAA